MVNKIVRIGDQIVSLGGSIVDVPNPELEVRSTMDEEVDALLKEDVSIGDIVFEESTSVIPYRNRTDSSNTVACDLFIYKGKPHCVTVSEYLYYGSPFALWKYDNDEWNLVNVDWESGVNAYGVGYNIGGDLISALVDGDDLYIAYSNRPTYGTRLILYKWTGSLFRPINTPFFNDDESEASRNTSFGWTNQAVYGIKIFKESSGRILIGQAHEVGAQNSIVNDGNRIKIYEFNPTTEAVTELSIEPSATLGGKGYGVDFIEYDGSTLASVTGPNPTNPPGDTNHIWQILVWNSSTSRWDFWKGAPQYIQHTNQGKFLLDASGTLYFNTLTTGGTTRDVISMWIGPSDTDWSWSRNQSVDTSSNGQNYGLTTFKSNGSFYHVVAGDSLNTTDKENDVLNLIKYPGTTSSMEVLQNLDQNDIGRIYERKPYGSYDRRGFTSVDHIEHDGEIHVAAVRNGRGPGTTQFFKFNPNTERLEQNSPKIPFDGELTTWRNSLHQVNYQGSSFTLLTSNNDTQIFKEEDAGYFSGTLRLASFEEDIKSGSFYSITDLLDGSAGAFRYAVANSNHAANLLMYEFTPSSGHVTKLPGPVNPRTGASMYNISHAELSGNHYLWGTYWTNSDLLYFAQVSGTSAVELPHPDEASGMPHRSMYNTYCYVGCADAIAFDGKIFGCYGQWQNYGGGSSINNFSWDGQDWSYVSTSGTDPVRLERYSESRVRSVQYHVHDNNLYLTVFQEQNPYVRLYKYDSTSNLFLHQTIPNALQITHRQYGFSKLFTHNDKLHYLITEDDFYGPSRVGILQDDGSWDVHLIGRQPSPRMSATVTHPLVINGELYFTQPKYLGAVGQMNYKFDATFRDGGWRKYRGGPFSTTDFSLGSIGVALESGTKGSTIKVRRKV